ncbi:MAG TPA: hypothetical protein P5509_04240 [Bacteroidales bacterium]|nr:hypothetical protein [Bacteroidales bacterium]
MRKIKLFFKKLADVSSFLFALLSFILIKNILNLFDKFKLARIKKRHGVNSWEYTDAKNKAQIELYD